MCSIRSPDIYCRFGMNQCTASGFIHLWATVANLQCSYFEKIIQKKEKQRGNWTGSVRHLYVVCIYGEICIQIQKYFPPDRAVFSPKKCDIDSIVCCVQIYEKYFKISWQSSKIWCFKNKICRHICSTVDTNYVEISSSSQLKCSRRIPESGNVQPMKLSGFNIGPTREEALMISALDIQWTRGELDKNVQLPFFNMCVTLLKFTSRPHRRSAPELHYICTVCGTLAVKFAPLRIALLQLNSPLILLLVNKLSKIIMLKPWTKNHFSSSSLNLFYVPMCL
jgi:hypothetical protein